MKSFRLIIILALVYVFLSSITVFAHDAGLVFVGLNAGSEKFNGSSRVDNQGFLLGGTVKYFSKYYVGAGLSYFQGVHDVDDYNGSSRYTNYSLDLMVRFSDSDKLLPYALLSLGGINEKVSGYSSPPDDFVTGLGVGALILPETSTGLTFGGELRYITLQEKWRADKLLLVLLSLGYSF